MSHRSPPPIHEQAAIHAACDALAAENARLRELLQALVEATEPYVEKAAPGEEITGYWAGVFERLQEARHSAREALAKEAT